MNRQANRNVTLYRGVDEPTPNRTVGLDPPDMDDESGPGPDTMGMSPAPAPPPVAPALHDGDRANRSSWTRRDDDRDTVAALPPDQSPFAPLPPDAEQLGFRGIIACGSAYYLIDGGLNAEEYRAHRHAITQAEHQQRTLERRMVLLQARSRSVARRLKALLDLEDRANRNLLADGETFDDERTLAAIQMLNDEDERLDAERQAVAEQDIELELHLTRIHAANCCGVLSRSNGGRTFTVERVLAELTPRYAVTVSRFLSGRSSPFQPASSPNSS